MTTFIVACIQTTSSRNISSNIKSVRQLVLESVDMGADLILLPETVNMMEPKNILMREKVMPEVDDAFLAVLLGIAQKATVWILAGSLVVIDEQGRIVNRSFLIGPDGKIQSKYDKVHMFDVDLGNGEYYRESKSYEAGTKAVIADLPWGRLGLSVCYDMRFPYLYRKLAKDGADFLSVPSAFTRPTGKAHWHVLLRARAIENGCYVFAPAQCGVHDGGRKTYGHSLIVDPWGRVLADGGDDIGIIIAEVDVANVSIARAKIPSLTHDQNIV
jgi:predicted amidohydrolase